MSDYSEEEEDTPCMSSTSYAELFEQDVKWNAILADWLEATAKKEPDRYLNLRGSLGEPGLWSWSWSAI